MANASNPGSSTQASSAGAGSAPSTLSGSIGRTAAASPNPDIGRSSGGAGGGTLAVPSLAPPAEVLRKAAKSAASAGTTWNNSQLVNGLWSINQDRNSWVGVAGVGWIKLSTASDTGIIALTVLSSHAKQLQSSYNYRTEDDGMIHEIYAW